MDTNGINAGAGNPLATPPARPNSANASQMGIGDQLNAMSGVTTEKNVYGEKKSMDKDAFLKMFMEQLKYQDPMKPQNSDQFTQQMAQFSQLEQTLQTNKHLEKMISQQNNMQVAALQLVGKDVTADRSGLYHDKGKISPMSFKLPNDLSDIQLEIIDPAGEKAKVYKIGDRSAGDVTWKWDGMRDNGAPAESGKYSYRIKGKGIDGKEVNINTKVDGRVSGVTSSSGIVYLMIGEQKIALNDVEMIKDPTANKDIADKTKTAVFKPTSGANGNAAKNIGEETSTPQTAPEGSISGVLAEGGNEGSVAESTNESGTNSESEINNGQKSNSNDVQASQDWDRLNPMMPLNLR